MPGSLAASRAPAEAPPTEPRPPRPAPPPAVSTPTLLALRWGAGSGALLYGGGVSLLHLLHNRAAGLSPLDALALLAWCRVLYGALVAAGTALPMRVLRLLSRAVGSALARRH